ESTNTANLSGDLPLTDQAAVVGEGVNSAVVAGATNLNGQTSRQVVRHKGMGVSKGASLLTRCTTKHMSQPQAHTSDVQLHINRNGDGVAASSPAVRAQKALTSPRALGLQALECKGDGVTNERIKAIRRLRSAIGRLFSHTQLSAKSCGNSHQLLSCSSVVGCSSSVTACHTD